MVTCFKHSLSHFVFTHLEGERTVREMKILWSVTQVSQSHKPKYPCKHLHLITAVPWMDVEIGLNAFRNSDKGMKSHLTYKLTGHFIRHTLLVPGWTPFAFRTALILRGIDSTRCWKHSSDILVHINMIASCSCCRFVGYTSIMRISRSTTS